MTSRIDQLAEIFGSLSKTADALGVSVAVVSRWKSTRGHRAGNDRIPTRYNHALRFAAKMIGKSAELEPLLDPDECPCCGRRLEPGQQLSEKMVRKLELDGRKGGF